MQNTSSNQFVYHKPTSILWAMSILECVTAIRRWPFQREMQRIFHNYYYFDSILSLLVLAQHMVDEMREWEWGGEPFAGISCIRLVFQRFIWPWTKWRTKWNTRKSIYGCTYEYKQNLLSNVNIISRSCSYHHDYYIVCMYVLPLA